MGNPSSFIVTADGAMVGTAIAGWRCRTTAEPLWHDLRRNCYEIAGLKVSVKIKSPKFIALVYRVPLASMMMVIKLCASGFLIRNLHTYRPQMSSVSSNTTATLPHRPEAINLYALSASCSLRQYRTKEVADRRMNYSKVFKPMPALV